MHRFRLIYQKLNSNGFFRPLVVTHLFKIQILTINYLAKFLIKLQRFRLIHQNLNSKGFLRPLLDAHLFKIPFSTKNFLAKFFLKMHRFRLIHQKLNSNGFFRILVETESKRFFLTPGDYTFVQNAISYKKFPSKISYKNASNFN